MDEAFLDVTGSRRLFGEGRDIAEKIRRDVRNELGLVISAGIAPNKFLAKLASAQAKPDGVFQVPERVDDFLLSLPLKRLWGVGPVLLKSLQRMGLRTVADLRNMKRSDMERCFGQAGERLIQLAYGKDKRPVESQRTLKSIGHEDTFDQDVFERETMHVALLDLVERVAARLRKHGLIGTTLTLKVKYSDFSTVTRSRSIVDGICHAEDMLQLAKQLLEKTEAGEKPVRLLGVSLANLVDAGSGQGLLFDEDRRHQLKGLEQAMDHVRERYGEKGICRATLVGHRRRSLTGE